MTARGAFALGLIVAGGCEGDGAAPDLTGVGLVGDGLANPFPSRLHMAGGHVAIPPDALPQHLETPVPVERVAWRTGFSPSQSAVVHLEGIDPAGFPGPDAIAPGTGSVRLFDLTDAAWLPTLAELDAHPDADDPVLVVRPLAVLPVGHDVAVVVTTEAAARPPRFDALARGEPPPDLAVLADGTRALLDALDAAGLPADQVALAWDFPVGDGTAPLRSALAQLEPRSDWELDRVRHLDLGDRVAPLTFRAAEGSFEVEDYLVDDVLLDLQPDGTVLPVGTARAELYVHVPASVADAAAGSVPILVFGHGIFGEPAGYLDDPEDPSGLLALADEAGVVVVATTWRGLTYGDLVGAVSAASDFGRIPEVTDRLIQGQLNARSLIALARDPAFHLDPVLANRAGEPLVDPSRVVYYGISLGAIQGAVLWAQDPPLDAAALHVGGAMWSTMLERSSNWVAFELLMEDAVEDPAERQLLYAASQLWWDPVDPMSWVAELRGRPFLLQESIGDEQVPNLTTEALARSVALPVLGPEHHVPWDVEVVPAPLPPGSRALVQFDPELPLPVDANRPAEVTGAHESPRRWAGARRQVVDYLRPGLEGQVVHHCGEAPCSASNRGE